MSDLAPIPLSSSTINTPGLDDEEQMESFNREFNYVLTDSAQYILRINDMDDARFCRWLGQNGDGRKWTKDRGQAVFPWEGASDSRVWLIDDTVNDNVRIMMAAAKRARMQAKATNYLDAPYAQAVSIVLDYVLKNEMNPEWTRELKFAANWREHIGASVMQIDWYWQTGTEWKVITMADLVQIGRSDQNFMAMLQFVAHNHEHLNPQDVQMLGKMLQQIWLGISNPMVALQSLQQTGSYGFENPYIKQSRPSVYALAPCRDVFFPLNTYDLQRGRWIVRRDMKNEVDLEESSQFESWDPEFYEQIKRLKGQSVLINYINSHRAQLRRNKDLFIDEFREMFEVYYAYYTTWTNSVRKVWVMPFHPMIRIPAQKQLLPYEHGEFPFVVFRRDHSTRSIIESRGVADISEPAQNEIKTQRDSRTDRTSFATLPPLAKPLSRGKTKFNLGPAAEITEVRPGEVHFLEIPQMDQTTIQVEASVRADHDLYFGKENEAVNPQRILRVQQEIADDFLGELGVAVKQIGKLCQQFMSPEEWTAVCHSQGTPFHAMTREEIQKDFHLFFAFDVKDLNMEFAQQKAQMVQEAAQMDQTGTVDKDALVRWYIQSIDPVMADSVLRPPQSVSQREINDTQNDLVKMSLGLQVPLPTTGVNASLRLQVLQQGVQQSKPMQSLFQANQIAVQILQGYVKALQFQIQQQKNAQIGRVGAAPTLPGSPQPDQP